MNATLKKAYGGITISDDETNVIEVPVGDTQLPGSVSLEEAHEDLEDVEDLGDVDLDEDEDEDVEYDDDYEP